MLRFFFFYSKSFAFGLDVKEKSLAQAEIILRSMFGGLEKVPLN